jgi:hypothetical protein
MGSSRSRAVAAIAALSLSISSASIAGAAGTVVITKLGEKPETFTGARLVLRATTLLVTMPDGRELDFAQSTCQNTSELMECQPVDVALRTQSGTHNIDFTDGLGYFNLIKVPLKITTQPPQTLPRNGLSLILHDANGTTVTVRGTLDVGTFSSH